MKPELRPGFGRQERRQAGQRRIDQHGDAALGERADLADRQRDHVGGEGDRLGVEIAARQRLVGVGEDQRIVGDAVGLVGERRRGLAQEIEAGAHHLRLAAQAIGVLHPLVAGDVRGADRAARHQRAQGCRGVDLAAMAAQGMDARVERRVRAARRVGRQRADDQRRAQQRLRLEQADERVGGGELRAVEQREPFLRRRARSARGRLRASASAAGMTRSPTRASPTPIIAAAIWASGARSPEAPTEPCAGTIGVTPARQHRFEKAKRLAAARRRRLARGCRASAPSSGAPSRRASGSPTPAAWESTMLRCSCARSAARDAHARELAEAGVDAVDRLAAIENALDRRRARRHRGLMRGIERDGRAAPDRAPIVERRRAGSQRDGHRPLQTRACRGLKPRR